MWARVLSPEWDFLLAVAAALVSTVAAIGLGEWLLVGGYPRLVVGFVEIAVAAAVYLALCAVVWLARRRLAGGDR